MDYVAYENMMYSMEQDMQDVRDWLEYEADMMEQASACPTDEEMERMAKALA